MQQASTGTVGFEIRRLRLKMQQKDIKTDKHTSLKPGPQQPLDQRSNGLQQRRTVRTRAAYTYDSRRSI